MMNNQSYNDIKYGFFCDGLEKQYDQAKADGIFRALGVLELDKEHSDSHLVQAIDYFNEKEGVVEEDAPMGFLSEREKNSLNKEGNFRSKLYCMFLSQKFSEAIENKSVFLKHSYRYAFDSGSKG